MTRMSLSRSALAQKVAHDLPVGSYVNLGIGRPTEIADYTTAKQQITFHTENGLLGVGPLATGEEINTDLINAGKIPVTIVPGASFFDHAQSFGMIRGGHLDFCILGAYQVSINGDIANWKIKGSTGAPAVGGAMDLVIGAKNVYVMMDLFDKNGNCKLVQECTYPLTGVNCVNRVYTDRAVFEITPAGIEVRETFGMNLTELRVQTGLDLRYSTDYLHGIREEELIK